MDQLSSCYFCGGALDVSLSEYPIVPKSLDPDTADQGTVVLCSTCRAKLATVVEPVVEAATADARGAGETASGEPPGLLDDSETSAADQPTATDSAVAPADDEPLLGDDAAEADDEESPDLSADEFESHPASSSAGAADSTSGETDEADTTGDRQPTSAEASRSESEAATGSQKGEAGDGGGPTDEPTLTKLEYNKVMRLLQNRAMPVDRAEIRAVAVNAYDIDGEQFDAIIDAAVQRDLIGQENGQLVESN